METQKQPHEDDSNYSPFWEMVYFCFKMLVILFLVIIFQFIQAYYRSDAISAKISDVQFIDGTVSIHRFVFEEEERTNMTGLVINAKLPFYEFRKYVYKNKPDIDLVLGETLIINNNTPINQIVDITSWLLRINEYMNEYYYVNIICFANITSDSIDTLGSNFFEKDSMSQFKMLRFDGVNDTAIQFKQIPEPFFELNSDDGLVMSLPDNHKNNLGLFIKANSDDYWKPISMVDDRKYYRGFVPSPDFFKFYYPHSKNYEDADPYFRDLDYFFADVFKIDNNEKQKPYRRERMLILINNGSIVSKNSYLSTRLLINIYETDIGSSHLYKSFGERNILIDTTSKFFKKSGSKFAIRRMILDIDENGNYTVVKSWTI